MYEILQEICNLLYPCFHQCSPGRVQARKSDQCRKLWLLRKANTQRYWICVFDQNFTFFLEKSSRQCSYRPVLWRSCQCMVVRWSSLLRELPNAKLLKWSFLRQDIAFWSSRQVPWCFVPSQPSHMGHSDSCSSLTKTGRHGESWCCFQGRCGNLFPVAH